ncbi:nitrogen regulatory protein P-II [Clostridia bacterium]|nr:nitrogen regulatory protein P-II [Clostridia bacterium]GHV13196.1 nitrogen regulatory protein P-II [Clostridia bacterium]
MKLILAIVHNDDSMLVSSSLTKAGYHVTKIASTGGFLMSGNTTFITGVEDDEVDKVSDIISKYSKKRMQPVVSDLAATTSVAAGIPAEVQVGGGTIFVLGVERFDRV